MEAPVLEEVRSSISNFVQMLELADEMEASQLISCLLDMTRSMEAVIMTADKNVKAQGFKVPPPPPLPQPPPPTAGTLSDEQKA